MKEADPWLRRTFTFTYFIDSTLFLFFFFF